MGTVTSRVKSIKQPRGGYLPVSSFDVIQKEDNLELNKNEDIHPSLVGMAVDYLSRFMISKNKKKSFEIPLRGALNIGLDYDAKMFLSLVKGLDNNSIYAAVNLVQFDQFYRTRSYDKIDLCELMPNTDTIQNIKIMVKRALKFFEEYGPVEIFGATFEGGYTKTITNGDADFLTKDTIWDIKVLKDDIQPTHTLQLLVYYILGLHSKYEYYKNIKNIGIFNPRKNVIYICSVSSIPNEIMEIVKNVVVCY